VRRDEAPITDQDAIEMAGELETMQGTRAWNIYTHLIEEAARQGMEALVVLGPDETSQIPFWQGFVSGLRASITNPEAIILQARQALRREEIQGKVRPSMRLDRDAGDPLL